MIHGFVPPNRFFPYLTWTDIRDLPDPENTVIIQPMGAIEQHGPHLPIAVDAVISVGVLGKALEQLESQIPAYALPCMYYGKSNEHSGFPGTITLTATTVLTLLNEIADSLYQSGFRKLILMNSHGGQPQILEIAARNIHEKYPDFSIFPLFTWRVPHIAAELLTTKELEYGIHAGDAETSLMLALLPEQVKLNYAVKEYPQNLPQNSLLSLEGNLPWAWLTRELTKSGVVGDATVATKEKGDRLLDSLAQGWVQVIRDVYQFRQPSPD
jgi:creatinine amidohydrolase